MAGPRRIVVALDESAASRAALEAAAALAKDFGAELIGVYIEDARLVALSLWPGARAVTHQGAATIELDEAVLMRSMRAQARRIEAALAEVAGALGIAWRFEALRGAVAEELLKRTSDCEMLAIGASVRARGRALGSTAAEIVERARCSVFVVRERRPVPGHILALYAGSRRAIDLGESLARVAGARLVIQPVTTPGDGAGARPGWLEAVPAELARIRDVYLRQAPAQLIVDRRLIAALALSPRALAEELRAQGFLVTDGED